MSQSNHTEFCARPDVTADALESLIGSAQERKRILSLVRLRLAFTIFVTLVLACLLGLVVLLVSQIFGELTPSIRADLIWKARHGAVELAKSAEYGIALRDAATINQVLAPYLKDSDVRHIVVVDANNDVIVAQGSDPRSPGDLFSTPAGALRESPHDFTSWAQSEIEGGIIGRVAVVVSTNRLHAGARLKRGIILTYCGGALLALLVTLSFVGLYVGPLIRVTETAFHKLKATTKQALEASRLKSEFIANVSHEIRTPMNGVLGMIELLQLTELTSKQGKYASTLRDSARALMDVLNDVLDFAKLEAGKAELKAQNCRPREFVPEIMGMFQAHAELKGLRLISEIDQSVPTVIEFDSHRLRQILSNFIGNAVKFTDRGSVTVAVRATSSSASRYLMRFAVVDTGIGIPASALGQLFVPFSQVDGSLTRQHGGTGLGLVICRSLAKLMHGDVGVTSQPGVGSEFWVEIPAERAISTAPKSNADVEATAPLALNLSGRVLVAEDNGVNREVIGEMLAELGCEFDFVEDGAAAVEAVEQKRYALVLMDCQMPVMDGYTATRRIRAKAGPGERIPIIAVTAHATQEERAKSTAAGMDDHLVKPYTMRYLADMLGRWMACPSGIDNNAAVERNPEVLVSIGVAQANVPSVDVDIARSPNVIRAFMKQVPLQLDRIEQALISSDTNELKEAAHKLKGGCSMFGAARMAELGRQLEMGEGDSRSLHQSLLEEYQVVCASLPQVPPQSDG